MAVTVAPPVAEPAEALRPVRVRHFVRLKLRILGNGLRGRSGKAVGFVFAALAGLVFAVGGFALFGASSQFSRDAGFVTVTLGGTALVLGWTLFPLLFFGVDETLDPARFALLPLPRRTLALGMLGAALIGIPPVATTVALLGMVLAAVLRSGVAGGLVAAVGVALALLLCVVASRSITSALAGMLRSRRARDLAGVILALLGASIGPAQLAFRGLAVNSSITPALRSADVLSWTPLGAAFAAPYDLVDGRPLVALARLAIVAVSVGLLLWWWSHTLESAMLGGSSSGVGSVVPADGVPIRAVALLLPRLLRRPGTGAFTAIVARELRYWSRDPRRRAALIGITIGGAVVPIALRASHHGSGGVPLPVTMVFPGLVVLTLAANLFGFDGSAYSVHLLAGVPGRVDLRARVTAIAMIMLPLLLVVLVIVGVISGGAAALVPSVGVLCAVFGSGMATACFLAVLAAYPVPDSSNAFAARSGGGGLKGFVAVAGLLISALIVAPVIVVTLLLPDGLRWIMLPVGIGWGLGAILLSTGLAGRLVDRRGPELLTAVTATR